MQRLGFHRITAHQIQVHLRLSLGSVLRSYYSNIELWWPVPSSTLCSYYAYSATRIHRGAQPIRSASGDRTSGETHIYRITKNSASEDWELSKEKITLYISLLFFHFVSISISYIQCTIRYSVAILNLRIYSLILFSEVWTTYKDSWNLLQNTPNTSNTYLTLESSQISLLQIST